MQSEFVTLNSDALSITVLTENPSDVGVYFLSLNVNLVLYPDVKVSIPFKVTINQ